MKESKKLTTNAGAPVEKMKIRKILCFLGLLAAAILLISPESWAQLFDYGRGPTKPGTHAPVIAHSFAVDKGYYGYIWKIYLEAEDPDSDMLLAGTERIPE